MEQTSAIPVCTLFNEPGDASSGDGSTFTIGPSLQEKVSSPADITVVSAENTPASKPSSPAVCNIFQSTPSSEDLFGELVKPSSQTEDNTQDSNMSQSQANLPEMQSTLLADQTVPQSSEKRTGEMDNIGQNMTGQLSPSKHHEDTDVCLQDEASETTDMMTSIKIHEGNSMENISNISLEQDVNENIVRAVDELNDGDAEVLQETSGVNQIPNPSVVEKADLPPKHAEISEVLHQDNATSVKHVVPHDTTEQPTAVGHDESVAPLASTLFSSSGAVDAFTSLTEGAQPASPTDAFTHALTSSESDRRNDAWIPSESTQIVLTATAQSQKRIYLEEGRLVRPGLGTSELLGDPIKAVLARYKGSESVVRNTLSTDSVTADEQGLKQLIDSGNLRSAVDLCGKVLTSLGQGFGQQTQESTNSPVTLQWWNARLFLLMRLKLHDLAETEISRFGEFDSADLYYGFYPDVYPGRQGSIVPFSLRLLYAEMPRHANKPGEAAARLYNMLEICEKILKNLNMGMSEIGSEIELKPVDRDASTTLWTDRKIKVMYSLGSTLIHLKEFEAAIKTYEDILILRPSDFVALQSGIGRTLLQIGDIKSAQQRFTEVEKAANHDSECHFQLVMNRGFLYLGANKWNDALLQFTEAAKLEPYNLEAQNNKAVCLLYMCRLKDAIATLENVVNVPPAGKSQAYVTASRGIPFEGALNNLVTMYELESTRSFQKKQILLQQLAVTVGDGFDVTCLKL